MIPIISIVGRSDSGKTTLIEKLVPELVRRGWRVATVKHDVHGFDVDHEGKDSWRHKRAGAHTVILSSPTRLALIRDVPEDLPLDAVRARFVQDVDLILTEGYKREAHPKIEVYRRAAHPEPLCEKSDVLIAVASDDPVELGVPRFGLDDAAGLAALIESRFLERPRPRSVTVRSNGRTVPMKEFVRDFVEGAVRGMLGALHDCDPQGAIDIHLDPLPPSPDGETGGRGDGGKEAEHRSRTNPNVER
jgi:molybdopterin-guanine dinucleotide biosynthesis protein B